ncbi:MAG: diadenylate cyclase CdaA [Candidatus Kapabacteria bacterium]|jgi:diadenylate cyclase|nr:diadenylate cyclase CdaA [Candidatus Kapabacteria bacterium]
MIDIFSIGFVNITLMDLVDIGIITITFYWLYRSLKNTVAIQILFGLVIIVSVSFITEAANLKSVNWILSIIKDIWLIAFVVLFQPELRRLLLKLTRSPIFNLFVRSKISETIDFVIEASIEFSEKHVGALIVFTRTQNVEMTVDTGIALNASVSKELLASIFNTKSPLHDGAVIIDNQMIIAARCVLPLSTVTRYDKKNLGTRHRAGLGLSEQVDTIVLIVSEETGNISIAESGTIDIDIPKDQFPAILRKRLAESTVSYEKANKK